MQRKFKNEDKDAKERIEAKNGLESYAYSLRNTITEDTLKEKISADDKDVLDKKVSETISWLDAHPNEKKDGYEQKKKELESVANPIMQKLYGQAGGAPGGMPNMPGGFPGAGAQPQSGSTSQGPTIEEVD